MDKQTSRALLDFSYHLAIGDMNEAYKVNSCICCCAQGMIHRA